MTPDDARAFFRTHHRAVIATQRADGGVQMTPVAAVYDEDGTIVVSSRETAVKTRNLRRHPRAWVIGLDDGFFGQWVQAEGPVVIESLPDAMEALVRYFRLGFGEHSDWDDYRAAMVREQRVILRLTIDRAGPNVQG
ncbi:MAG TPA: PPOX class F420-dependent oxidoreductase [Candidatus Dormibacteraeota bacterium]|nr:PPOX class F420-dependent oxidoreductase [Candidatus Dormibacteraeota bacterium]